MRYARTRAWSSRLQQSLSPLSYRALLYRVSLLLFRGYNSTVKNTIVVRLIFQQQKNIFQVWGVRLILRCDLYSGKYGMLYYAIFSFNITYQIYRPAFEKLSKEALQLLYNSEKSLYEWDVKGICKFICNILSSVKWFFQCNKAYTFLIIQIKWGIFHCICHCLPRLLRSMSTGQDTFAGWSTKATSISTVETSRYLCLHQSD